MKHVRYFSLLLAFCLLLACLPVTTLAVEEVAGGTCGSRLTWTLNSIGTLVISGEGNMTDFSHDGIGNTPWAAYQYDIQKVVIEEGVTSVGAYAFHGCNMLAEADLPYSLTVIGDGAFQNTCIREIVLPNCLERIGQNAFFSTLLTTVHIPQNVSEIAAGAFAVAPITGFTVDSRNTFFRSDDRGALYDKAMTTLLRWPHSADHSVYESPEGVTTIGQYAFSSCYQLTEVHLGDSVTSIESHAFSGCSLTDLTFGEGEITLESYAFADSGIQRVGLPDTVIQLGEGVFSGCYNLQEISIGSGVTAIPAKAFYNCSQLCDVQLPDTLTAIGEKAFANCTALSSIHIPEHVTEIGKDAFSYSGLFQIQIPDSVVSLGRGIFSYCPYLSEVTIGSGVRELPQGAFQFCQSLYDVTLHEGLTSIGMYAFWSTPLTGIRLPHSVTSIGNYAFYECANLSDATLGSGLQMIKTGAFQDCPALTSIHLPEGITSIGTSAFQGTGLTEITFPDSLEAISSYILDDCPNLTRITFGRNVKTIDLNIYTDSDGLTEITFTGNAPTYIDDYAFICNPITAYYPAGDGTWTADILKDYGCAITWVAMYAILEGDDTQWDSDSREPVTLRVDCDPEKFIELRVNGNVVPGEYYTLTEGSTVITLKPEYLASLPAGEYQVTILFTDSKALSSFTVARSRPLGDVNNDGTVDSTDACLVILYYSEQLTLDIDQLAAADVNGDGAVDLADAYCILLYHNGQITAFPAAN